MYCYVCAGYGHIVAHCPNKRAKAIRAGKSPKGIENLVFSFSSKSDAQKAFLIEKGVLEGVVKSTYIPEAKLKGYMKDYCNSLNPPHMLAFTND
jgi:hypothetical protein